MTDIQKFYSDIQRIVKHDRADHGGAYNASRACTAVIGYFTSCNRGLGGLPGAFADYWKKTYIDSSAEPDQEPTDAHTDVLAAMQSILDGTSDGTSCLTDNDWHELCQLTSFEAEDLPLETLNTMMTLFVDKGAL